MEKEFIPYEQALALKELGFDEPCVAIFGRNNELSVDDGFYKQENYHKDTVLAPTYSQAFRWFREKYNLREQYGVFPHHTIITKYLIDGNNEENAELECLKKLIEIVKKKEIMANYSIVIKTNQYAGNFERQLCAHLTGIIGECKVGEEYVHEAITEIFEDSVVEMPDDNGTRRPVSLGSQNGGATGHDVVIYFDTEPTHFQVEIIKERLLTFEPDSWVKGLEFKGIELIEYQKTFISVKL